MGEVMQENMDREDLIFFKSRIDSLNIEPIYTRRLFAIFDKALSIFDRIENDLELQYLLCFSIWNELSIICNLLFIKRTDDFFNNFTNSFSNKNKFNENTFLKEKQIS